MKTINEWIQEFKSQMSNSSNPKTWEKKRRCYECYWVFPTTQQWGCPARSTKCPRCGHGVDLYLDKAREKEGAE